MIVTSNADFAARLRTLRNQGRTAGSDWFEHAELGYNYRISEMNCALGIEQMKRIESILARRERIACEYNRRLFGRRDLILPPLSLPDRRTSWFVYVVRLHQRFVRLHRDWIVRELKTRGIECGRYFAPIHLQPSYQNRIAGKDLHVTEQNAERTIALPFFNNLSESQIDRVCENLTELLSRADDIRAD